MLTQKGFSVDDLSSSKLDSIMSSLTSDCMESEVRITCVEMTSKRTTSRFVCHSGLVPYETSDSDSSFEESVDIVNDSLLDSPMFRIPLQKLVKEQAATFKDLKDKSKCSDNSSMDKPSRFKSATSKEELRTLAGKSFAKSTDRKISWAVNLFRMWRQNRIDEGTGEGKISWCDVDKPDLDPEVLAHVLPTFINEIKRTDGQDYPPNTVYSIIVMMQLFFEKKGKTWKLLDGKLFNSVKNTVDNIMKRRSMARIAQKVKHSEPISITDEEEMWDFGILGEETPDTLRNTVMYLIGLTFALRGGKEHRALRNPYFDPQIVIKISEKSGMKYLVYTEDTVSKMNQGGLSG